MSAELKKHRDYTSSYKIFLEVILKWLAILGIGSQEHIWLAWWNFNPIMYQ